MMQLNHSQLTLLQILGDGCCHSGNELGQALGITRSAIWKQINQLIALGIPIARIPHQGYQLPNPLALLEQQQIANALQQHGFNRFFNIHLFTSIDSTNRYLKDLPLSQSIRALSILAAEREGTERKTGMYTQVHEDSSTVVTKQLSSTVEFRMSSIDICCAEIQTQGRGRFGRNWHSPFGENIYCSSRWNLNCDLSRLSGLSLITSLAVLATINEFSPSSDIKIKWPNDILWRDKKLCGSLIEIIAESHGNAQVIIGIGLNVNTDTKNHPLPDKPWCSLYEITQRQYDRNQIIAKLIINLEHYIYEFIDKGLNAFMDEWNQQDYLAGKYITVSQSSTTISGVARGINQEGLLLLEDEQGVVHYLSSGDTSLHYNRPLRKPAKGDEV
ncbi:biotin--[acetyl-CoA-carboxylase] ligase [Legionella fallonii]|uniref:Bifunctional ligase/repressor BirA n=1 Tax=Legionella fallonii LLAP-10 TaxID=1212491 RepID=A0A098G2P4_9GAMM|nr:biotin--[acetyl-CoA-carboxylase] ligase [Legionella fallonii]CEG56259.1 Biotin operon repressor/biotin-(Acetyl-CoA-carboxylase) synthetase BirA [Legionella fallonii LLAP-10]